MNNESLRNALPSRKSDVAGIASYGGGFPLELNSKVGVEVEPAGAAGHLPPVHLGMHMQPPKGNLAGSATGGAQACQGQAIS